MKERLLQLLRLRGVENIEDSVLVLTPKEIANLFPSDSGILLAIENVYEISRLVILSGGSRTQVSQVLDKFERSVSSLLILEILNPTPKFSNKYNMFIQNVIKTLVS